MRGLNSETFDLIYLDPPFKSDEEYSAPIGSQAAGAMFKDTWTLDDVKEEWVEEIKDTSPALWHVIVSTGYSTDDSMQAYLTYMSVRLLEMYRLLKSSGSIYFHCDHTASHYLKQLLDVVFGHNNFRNEIIWQRASGRAKGSQHKSKNFGSDVDVILRYSKSKKFTFSPQHYPLDAQEIAKKFPKQDDRGRYNTEVPIFCSPSMGDRPNLCYTYKGVTNPHPSGWRVSEDKLKEMDDAGEIIWRPGKSPQRKTYADTYKGKPVGTLWTDIPNITGGDEHTGYPTQKPLALMERIIKASSDEGDMVLDPFCGCATTCVAAETLKREWVGIDIAEEAKTLVVERLKLAAHGDPNLRELWGGNDQPPITHLTTLPKRTDSDAPSRSKNIKEILFKKQNELCAGNCEDGQKGRKFPIDIFEIDHIKPKSKGGADVDSNLQLLCPPCNGKKSSGSMKELRKKNLQEISQRTAEELAAQQRASQVKLDLD